MFFRVYLLQENISERGENFVSHSVMARNEVMKMGNWGKYLN